MLSNAQRAAWARVALDAFMDCHASDHDRLTSIGDLIVDLLHLARLEHGDDPEQIIARARQMNQWEREEDRDT